MTYLFSDNDKLKQYGFETVKEELAVLNPITSEMDGLRTTMLVNMLEAVQRNVNYGKKRVQLFEVGTVFDENREEKEQITFVYSGLESDDNVTNSGKPKEIEIRSFIDQVASVIGDFELGAVTFKNKLLHPYQSADIIKDDKVIGYISKLHPKNDFEIPTAFFAVVDIEPILPEHKEVKDISNFQASTRDLSVLIDSDTPYQDIKKILDALKVENLKSYYPIDIYEDESLKGKKSLSLRFVIQAAQKTLQDEDLNPIMDTILEELKTKAGAQLR